LAIRVRKVPNRRSPSPNQTGGALGIECIAEGVETKAQAKFIMSAV
jgi:predicted signal transduction protein with EAL and GGDEF domain